MRFFGKRSGAYVALTSIAAIGLVDAAMAQPSNRPPPAGAILDVAGQPITNIQQSY
jgi:hypothetical protein